LHPEQQLQCNPGILAKKYCKKNHFQVASRARLLEDSFTLARVGLYSYNQVLELSEYLMNETEYLPLLVFNNHVQLSYLMLRNHPRASMLKVFLAFSI